MELTFTILTIVVLLLSILPIFNWSHWTVRSMDFPRLQLTLIFSCVFIGHLLLLGPNKPESIVRLLVLFACIVWQLWWVLPFSPFWKKEVHSSNSREAADTIKVITANVLTTNRESQKLIDLVREYQPDILVTLESDQWWQDQLDCLEDELPFTVKCPLDNLYGMHVYSKLEILEGKLNYLVQEGVPSVKANIKLKSGRIVKAYFLHPAPPSPTENEESTERDAELVIVAREIAKDNSPTIVTGDLNDVAWSKTTRLFRKISGLLDPRVGRGMFNTFHASYWFMRWPLDHMFHSEHFTVSNIKRLPNIGSDHFSLFTELQLSPESKSNQDGLDSTKEDREFASEVIDKEKAKNE
ncbi:endonuclease/exonuclease/phosphatase family protein [Psychrosphaera haliotis]|uniref:endonuclease/exonuclease/phosphatase family protein n=1 Tax=Psychrosphaera haliotis TaxID=555083 RepID=UPI0031E05F7A